MMGGQVEPPEPQRNTTFNPLQIEPTEEERGDPVRKKKIKFIIIVSCATAYARRCFVYHRQCRSPECLDSRTLIAHIPEYSSQNFNEEDEQCRRAMEGASVMHNTNIQN